MADEGHEGQHLSLALWMLWQVKIQTQYANTIEFIERGPLNIGLSVLAFKPNKGQNKGQRFVHSVQLAWCWARQSQAICTQFKSWLTYLTL